MTPEEKAKELVNKMIIDFIDWTYFIPIDKTNGATIQTEAKQRALIAVDEMISVLPFTDSNASLNYYSIHLKRYLDQVKHEIEKL